MERNYEILSFDRLESTNSEATRHISGFTKPIWIWTKTQTRGRGRSGRNWHSGSKNFFATYLQKPNEPLQDIPLRSFLAGLALHETLCAFTEFKHDFYLKWPNDVILSRKKVAGILLENNRLSDENYLITGFGVNLHEVPALEDVPERKYDPGSIAQLTGFDISSREFLDRLIQKVNKYEEVYHSDGFWRIRELWLERAFDLGKGIFFRHGKIETRGIFEGIDHNGRAIVVTPDGIRYFSAGDMFFKDSKNVVGN